MYARKNTGMATPSRDADTDRLSSQLHSGGPRSTRPEPHSDREDHRGDRQLERGRPQSQHLLGDRPPGVDAVAEVELQRPDEELAVLDVPRLVQPVEPLDLRYPFRRCPL